MKYQTKLESIANIIKTTPFQKADLMRNLNLIKHASLNSVQNLLRHVDDRLLFKFKKENPGDVLAIKIYKFRRS